MIIIPAIDLKNGQCVRLKRGIMQDVTVFSDDPIKTAEHWVEQGATRLHLVDLDGAFIGKPVNADIISKISKRFSKLVIQIGGGIRDIKTASAYIEVGASYLIIGTMAVNDDEFIKQLCTMFPYKIIVGLDANNGLVATDGWTLQTNISVINLAKKFETYKLNSIIYTDIGRDGMMQGVNIEAIKELAQQTSIDIIASGGITNIKDIISLNTIKHHGVIGAISGRAIYEGTLNFKQAQQICNDY